MTTFAFLPGLLSDRVVWEPLAEQLQAPAYHADFTTQSSLSDMASSVLEATEDELIVVGHSMGGRVALEIARLAPDRVRALVLANTGHSPKRPGEERNRQAKIDQGYEDFAGLAADWLRPMVAPHRVADSELMTVLTGMVMRQSPEIHERQIRALISRPDAGRYLPDVSCPILLVTGAEDGWAPELQHREMADMAPEAEVFVVGGAGHFLPLERPNEMIRIVQDWLFRKQDRINV